MLKLTYIDGCRCLGFLTNIYRWLPVFGIFNVQQMLMHAVAHRGCADSVTEVDWEKNPSLHRGLEPASVLRLAFQSDALPAELSPPLEMICVVVSACANDLCGSFSLCK